MNYIKVNILLKEPFKPFVPEIISARLAESDFESFEETRTGLLAYIPENLYDEAKINSLLTEISHDFPMQWQSVLIEDQNWNEVWEKNYEPVLVAGRCYIRAPFHEKYPAAEFDLIIEPKMSFGTAHHETTSMMIGLMLEHRWKGKRVLDMGCGTGVLAILASKMGAPEVIAIDNDEWAFDNAMENTIRNNSQNVIVLHGDNTIIPPVKFDVILANINRNILLSQFESYVNALKPKGEIYLSGFYDDDVEILLSETAKYGFRLKEKTIKNQWVAMIVAKDVPDGGKN